MDGLIGVHILFRHGNRTPLKKFDKAPFNLPNVTWPQGYDTLTVVGKEKLFRLGEHFRQKYGHLIGDEPNSVAANSSKADRCIDSCEQLIKGLFPSKFRDIKITAGICGQVDAFTMDQLCPLVSIRISEILRSPSAQRFLNSNRDLVDLVATVLKLDPKSLFFIPSLIWLHDNYVVYRDHGLQLPHWYTDDTDRKLSKFHPLGTSLLFDTRVLSRVQYSFMYKSLCDRLTETINHGNGVKMYLYAVHDWTLVSLLTVLGAFDARIPPYGASVIVELHQVSGEYLLKFLYLPEPDTRVSTAIKLPLAGGADLCPVQKFIDSIRDLMPSNEFKCKHGPH